MDLEADNFTDFQNLTMFPLNRFSAYALLLLAVTAVPGSSLQIQQCRGVDLDMTEDHVMHINECLKDAGAKEVKDIAADKMPCFGKCVFAKKGLIDDKGMPHKEKILTMIADKLPKGVHDDMNKRMTGCLLPNNTEMIDPADVTCTTYLPVLMCMHIAFLEECA